MGDSTTSIARGAGHLDRVVANVAASHVIAGQRPSQDAAAGVLEGRVWRFANSKTGIDQVLAAVGLDFDALYRERAVDNGAKRERRPFSAFDVLSCLGLEALVAAVAASRIAQGEPLHERDRERLIVAASRLQSAVEVARGA
jgi:hypothetical protein